MFRHDFTLKKNIERATINISGLGQYELFINGKKVGDHFLAPGWTLYQKKSFYNTFDVTNYLYEQENTLGAVVGPGFYYISRERYRKLVEAYGYPKLIFHLTVNYKDGTEDHIISDEHCRVSPSPITFSSIYGGEDYDARLEKDGWASPGFDDSSWKKAIVLEDPTSQLFQEKDNPLKVMQEFNVKRKFTSETGRTIYDFGQNASGIVSIKVRGERGAHTRIIPGELIDSLGNVTQRSSGGPYEYNYILNGRGTEEWQPAFSYYGFRFADIEITEPEDLTDTTEILDVKLLHTRNSAPETGTFKCSDTLFNQIYDLIKWGIENNMASVATDCPHREKLGWLEQTYLIGPSMHYNFDIHSFYSKIIGDMSDSQLDDGLVPDIAPEYVPFKDGFRDSPEWGSASVIIPWQIYRWYGDTATLKIAYPMMKRYVAYLEGKLQDGILNYGLGDWYDLGPNPPGEAQLTPKGVTATSIFYYDLMIMKKIAEFFGHESDVRKFSALAEKVQDAFLVKYFYTETALCASGSQTSYAMPLYTGIIPEKYKEKAFRNLTDSIIGNDYALTAGDIGYYFLVGILSKNGRSDILYRMNNRTDRPGYGYQLVHGATALTESWSARPELSNDHMMLGHLMAWFFNGLGGIGQSDSSVAYRHVTLAPKPVEGMEWVKCSFHTPNGMISTNWKADGSTFRMDFSIPGGSVGTITLPGKYTHITTVTDAVTGHQVGVTITNGTFDINSGSYQLTSK